MVSRKNINLKIKQIAKDFKINVKFEKINFTGYFLKPNIIVINKSITIRETVSTFFHELGHYIDFKNKLFSTIYDDRTSMKTKRKIVLRAEIHADKIGERYCRKYFPKIRYERVYRSKSDQKFLHLYYKNKEEFTKKDNDYLKKYGLTYKDFKSY